MFAATRRLLGGAVNSQFIKIVFKAIVFSATVATTPVQAATLFDNGPVVVSGLSVVQPPDDTIASSLVLDCASCPNFWADDFSIPVGQIWTVSDLNFSAFIDFATAFPFFDVKWRVVQGNVSTGNLLAAGTTPVTSSGLMGYRVFASSLGDQTRPIYGANADVPDFQLTPGAYWLQWSLTPTTGSRVWEFSTADSRVGNALILRIPCCGGPSPVADNGSGRRWDLPFVINGSIAPVPEPAGWVLMLAGATSLLWLRRVRNSRAQATVTRRT